MRRTANPATPILYLKVSIALLISLSSPNASAENADTSLNRHLRSVVPCNSLIGKSTFCDSSLTIKEKQSLDAPTGLEIPRSPHGHRYSKLPDDALSKKYATEIGEFLKQREKLLKAKDDFQHQRKTQNFNLMLATDIFEDSEKYFISRVSDWNGSIFWAPASNSNDIIIRAGDEIRSVFGSIPPFDVTTLGERTNSDGWRIVTANLPTEVDGNRVQLRPNSTLPGSPLEFEHTDVNGNHIKWTTSVDKCDKPSLAGGVTPCGAASRISRAVKGNIEWISLARKARGVETLKAESYWSPDDPTYTLLGYIGFNRVSGEVAFFDGSYPSNGSDPHRFNWNTIVVPPGGTGYDDDNGRQVSSGMYDPNFSINCAACHDNKEPRIITPYIKQARVGYRDSGLAEVFSVGDLFPELMRNIKQPYRVVGSAYTSVHAETLLTDRAFEDPTGECASRCHGFTAGGTGRFTADSVGRLAAYDQAAGAETPAVENNYRTVWATRDGAGKIHPWMLPDAGNDLSGDPPQAELSDEAWKKLLGVIVDPSTDPQSLLVYTQAPAPESVKTENTRIADLSAPKDIDASYAANRDQVNNSFDSEIHLTWKYLNNFGGVPTRDDVRFNIAFIETDIPPDGNSPSIAQYPSIEQAKGLTASRISDGLFKDSNIIIFNDVSYAGHLRWTDATPTTIPRQYRVDFPARKGKRYLIRLLPVRHTFDQSQYKYSDVQHILHVDIK